MSLLEGVQGRRFVYSGPNDHGYDEDVHFVVAADLSFWLENYDEIESWVYKNISNAVEINGCVISFDNHKDVMAFLLQWS